MNVNNDTIFHINKEYSYQLPLQYETNINDVLKELYEKCVLNITKHNFFTLINLHFTFGSEYIKIILNNDNLIFTLLSLDLYNRHELLKQSYCLFYFEDCNITEYLSLHNAKGINFINKLLNIIEGNEEIEISTKIIHKIGDCRYIIIIPKEFYEIVSVATIEKLFEYLRRGSFSEWDTDKIALHKEGIQFLIDSFGGIDEKIFLKYNFYIQR
jgi:hypothetical protein